jgi:hypothetical protein
MDLQTSLIDLESIESVDQAKVSFDPSLKSIEIEYLAKAIVNLKGLLRIPVVEQVGIESYKLIAGHFDYYAYLKARTIDSSLPDRIRVFIVNPKKGTAKGILEQLEAIDRLGGERGGDNDSATDPIEQALKSIANTLNFEVLERFNPIEQALKSITNTINIEVLEKLNQLEDIDQALKNIADTINVEVLERLNQKLSQLEEKVGRNTDLSNTTPPSRAGSDSVGQNNMGQNLEKSLSELITRLAHGQLQATIELKTPPESLSIEEEILPPKIQDLKEIYEELNLEQLKKLAKKRNIDLASFLSKPLSQIRAADRPAIIGKILVWDQSH